jgi:hypothetical protein
VTAVTCHVSNIKSNMCVQEYLAVDSSPEALMVCGWSESGEGHTRTKRVHLTQLSCCDSADCCGSASASINWQYMQYSSIQEGHTPHYGMTQHHESFDGIVVVTQPSCHI